MSTNYENTIEWVEGYRAGYTAGYNAGIEDGRGQGYSDAKFRVKKALEVSNADGDVYQAVEDMVGILDTE